MFFRIAKLPMMIHMFFETVPLYEKDEKALLFYIQRIERETYGKTGRAFLFRSRP